MRYSGKRYNVIENDRMFNKQKIVAAKLLKEEASWLQLFHYQTQSDKFMQYMIEAEITRKWDSESE